MTSTENLERQPPVCECGCCGPTAATAATAVMERPLTRDRGTDASGTCGCQHASTEGCDCGCTDSGCECGCGSPAD